MSVSYRQFYVESRGEYVDEEQVHHCAGQRNGLCGAANPGHLYLTTGLHTGEVGLTVEVHEAAPPLDEQWEEVVEVSFRPKSPETTVVPWGEAPIYSLDLPLADHRVRYCGRGMDVSPDDELSVLDGGPPVDHYLLQFWPAALSPDRIVKQTTQHAAYWHDRARTLPPPPSPEERAEAERRQHEEQQAVVRAAERSVAGGLDRALMDAVTAAGTDTQRAVARWAACRAVVKAELQMFVDFAWAIRALQVGEALPEPFDDRESAWEWFFARKDLPHAFVNSPHDPDEALWQQSLVIPALLATAEEDPLRAALTALQAAAAAYGSDFRDLLAEVRASFPDLHRSS
ncbi:hypothetical protein GCM10010329_79940 [Streptomyces spiroverticillatus]|nr:hypothetical protein GCM10010329_79940 [Streptomyces spiroverticillatus]